MDPRLEEASHTGDSEALHRLLQEDSLLLAQFSTTTPSFANNPLHIAALIGHADFVREVLRLNPSLARNTNANGLTPLHLASAKGRLAVVRELLSVSGGSDLCGICDGDGLLPIHTAAAKGRTEVLVELMNASPDSVRQLTRRGETTLHWAVRSGCYKAVEVLVESIGIDEESFLNSKDDEGNTIMQLAAMMRQSQNVKMLLTLRGIEVNEVNARGLTVLDVLLEPSHERRDLALISMIKDAGGKTASEIRDSNQPSQVSEISGASEIRGPDQLSQASEIRDPTSEIRGASEIRGTDQPSPASEIRGPASEIRDPNQPSQSYSARAFQYCIELFLLIIRWSVLIISWLGLSPCGQKEESTTPQTQNSQKEERTTPQTLMVVATIIATITFQPVLSPPGGLDLNGKATRGPELLKFLVCDMIGLFASLSIILLLICVKPGQKKSLMSILVWVMWIAVFSTTQAFNSAALIIFPSSNVVSCLVDLWNVVSYIIVLWSNYRLAIYLFYLVGWWEPLNTHRHHSAWGWIALTIVRALVIGVAVVVPALCFQIILYYFRIVSFPHWSCHLLNCWAAMMEFPLLYLSFRLTVYLLRRATSYVGSNSENHLPVDKFNLAGKMVRALIVAADPRFFVRLMLFFAAIFVVTIQIYSLHLLLSSYNICKI